MYRRSLKNFLLGLVGAVVLTVVISLFTTATATARLSYSVTDLGTLSGDNFSQAFNINNRGQIFGWSRKVVGNTFADKTAHIFQWKNGTMTNLGNLITPSDYENSYIARINNKGQVVGNFSSINPLKSVAFLWQDGNLTDLGNLGGTYIEAIDINED